MSRLTSVGRPDPRRLVTTGSPPLERTAVARYEEPFGSIQRGGRAACIHTTIVRLPWIEAPAYNVWANCAFHVYLPKLKHNKND